MKSRTLSPWPDVCSHTGAANQPGLALCLQRRCPISQGHFDREANPTVHVAWTESGFFNSRLREIFGCLPSPPFNLLLFFFFNKRVIQNTINKYLLLMWLVYIYIGYMLRDPTVQWQLASAGICPPNILNVNPNPLLPSHHIPYLALIWIWWDCYNGWQCEMARGISRFGHRSYEIKCNRVLFWI